MTMSSADPTLSRRRSSGVARYGPWAVVTGASSGIGRAVAVELAATGFDVVLVARRGSELQDLATTLSATHRIRARVVAVDLATEGGRRALDRDIADLDVGLLVASAGYGTSGHLHLAHLEAEEDLLAVNCGAVLALTHTIARRLVARGRGGIVLLSSIVALQGVPGAAHYAATKAYVHTLGEGLAHELGPHGVDVLVAAPGPVASGFGTRARLNESGMDPAEVARDILAALGRRTIVRPGRLSKVLGWSLAAAPRRVRTRILARVLAGFAAEHDGPHTVGSTG